ncbi:MAG: zinc dependent phospholipase C family protein [Syntrophobacteraceae bacterium]|jgi:hypothetical protein
MPKERFHLYLADELLNRCAGSLPSNEIHSPSTHERTPAFSIGAISPDIFFYDLPSFSSSSLGNALHHLMVREGISIISGWIAQTCSPIKSVQASTVLWGLGFACHFLTDALWHPVINELSGSRLVRDYIGVKRLSRIECHRLLESELEALWLARSRAPQRYDEFLKDFKKDRGRLLEVASSYRRFLEFAGLSAGVSERRIVKCCLSQNFLLRLFASRMLGGKRDLLLSLPPTRALGALVTPVRPVLPALFSHALPEDRNPFSDYFMEHALISLEADLCSLAKQLSQSLIT